MDTVYVQVLEDLTAIDQYGNCVDVPLHALRRARHSGGALRMHKAKNGKVQWRSCHIEEYDAVVGSSKRMSDPEKKYGGDIMAILDHAAEYIPDSLVISDIRWKYLVRSVLRGKNCMVTGASGSGKTITAQAVMNMFPSRPVFEFNLGAMSDPQVALIGNTHFTPEEGTFTTPSFFIQAITTPKAIILLDEISRAHPDAHNILMPVLDPNQRYLRIDEDKDTPTIRVADGVTFLATANIGAEYTATRVLDRALVDRFVIIETPPLTKDEEISLLHRKFPQISEELSEAIADIAVHTRQNVVSEDPKISTIISTRMTVEIAGLLIDGFSLSEAAEVCIYPFYSDAGGSDSERTYVKQLVQKKAKDTGDEDGAPMTPDEDLTF